MIFFELLFWLCSLAVVFTYALYRPFLAFLVKFGKYRNPASGYDASDDLPSVTLVISAYNEAQVIKEKLLNAVATKYPKDKYRVVVISDASDDGTDNIVTELSANHPQISLHRQEQRLGKTAGINAAIEHIDTEIVVFSDANAMYRPDALLELVRPFKDKTVGFVVGAALYNADDNFANESESGYWDEELKIKELESKYCSVVGGDGAIYAIRRDLYEPLQVDDINDFANPLQIVAAGYRGIFTPKAICTEDSAEDFQKEYKRKRRIVNRSYRAFSRYWHRFSWSEHRRFLFLLIAHKVLRWFSGYLILISLLCAVLLSMKGVGWIYSLATAAIVTSMLLALIGRHMSRRPNCPKPIYFLYYFYLVNLGAMQGIVDNFRGQKHVTWDHIRKSNQG